MPNYSVGDTVVNTNAATRDHDGTITALTQDKVVIRWSNSRSYAYTPKELDLYGFKIQNQKLTQPRQLSLF